MVPREPPAVSLTGCVVKTSTDAAAGVMSNPAEVAPVRLVAEAVSVYPVPLLVRLRSEKFAIPAEATMAVVPLSTEPPGLVPIDTETEPLKPVAVFPAASWAVTCTAGTRLAPAAAEDGCTVKASLVATPGVMLKPELVEPVTPVADALKV